MGRILAVCISDKKGVPKDNIGKGVFKEEHGLVGDAHAGAGDRQVSLLAKESLDMMKEKGLKIGCGGFGENLTTLGIELTTLRIGTSLKAGGVLLEVTKIGKECQKPCAIHRKHGECILPSQGIFAKVLEGGTIQEGDAIVITTGEKISAGILIASDRSARGERPDECAPRIADALEKMGAAAVRTKIVPDDADVISAVLKDWSDNDGLDVLITSGGTGFSPRDVTPEATKGVIERSAPGLAEMLRAKSAAKTDFAYLSRGIAGIRGKTIIVNLPGSPKAVAECMAFLAGVLPHAVEVLKGKVKDCRGAKR